MRESFATTAAETAFFRSAFDSRAFDTGVSDWQNYIVNIGLAIGLLPEQRTLKLEDRKLNAVLAIVGVFLIGVSIILDLVNRWAMRRFMSWTKN